MSRLIQACPSCGSAQLRKRRLHPKFKCGKCGATFEVPMKREIKKMNKMCIPPSLQKYVIHTQVIQ